MSATDFAQPSSSSIIYTIDFLTRPLLMIYAPNKVFSLQRLLLTSLCSLLTQKAQPRVVITIASGTVAPRALYPACISAGIRWSDWFSLLGGTEFDLVLEPTTVSAGVAGQKKTLWTEQAKVDTSRLDSKQVLQNTLNSAIVRTRTRTLAQLILESPDEQKEADELLACISTTSIISPTPTRDVFPPIVPPNHSETTVISEHSRPSSRSSQSSSGSSSSSSTYLSSVSDHSGLTCASSVSSTPTAKLNLSPPVTYSRTDLPVVCNLPLPKPKTSFPLKERVCPTIRGQPSISIDNARKDVTKYLYQGGVSTVLTGGVMLGSCQPASSKKRNTGAPHATWRCI